jgi:GTP pyrophosphokinase
MSSDSSKIVKSRWSEYNSVEFMVGCKIIGQDRMGILGDLVRVISIRMKLNIRSITIDTEGGMFEGVIKLYVHNTDELTALTQKLRAISGVHNVLRISG